MSDFLRVKVNRKGWEIIQSFTSPNIQREDHSSAEEKALALISVEIYQEHTREFQRLFIKLTSCEPFQNNWRTRWTREWPVFYQRQQRNRLSAERRHNSATVLVTTSKQSIFLKVCRIMNLVLTVEGDTTLILWYMTTQWHIHSCSIIDLMTDTHTDTFYLCLCWWK